MRRVACLLSLVVLSSTAAFAQAQRDTTSSSPVFSEMVEVRIINVDVVVTDRNGKPVTGLSKDDFEILENGKKRELSNFLEYRFANAPAAQVNVPSAPVAATAAAEVAPAVPQTADTRSRKVIVFVDNSTLRPQNRNRVLGLMKDFIKTTVRANDEIMIATWGMRLDVPVPFTHDISRALMQLDDISKTNSFGSTLTMERTDAERLLSMTAGESLPVQTRLDPNAGKVTITEALTRAKLYALRAQALHHQKVNALQSVLTSVRGVEGRKVLVYVTEALDRMPGHEIFSYLEQMRDRFAGGENVNFENEARSYLDETLISRIAASANSSGVTLYPINPAGLAAGFDQISADSLASQFNMPTKRDDSVDERVWALRGIADATGGVANVTTNNFKLAFDTITNDLATYYSLGYRASGDKQDTTRAIKVRLKHNPGYIVRTRNSYVEKSASSEVADAVMANLFYPVTRNDLGIEMQTGTARPAPDGVKIVVPVEVKIPTQNLTLLPDGKDLTGRFSTYAAFASSQGAVTDVKKQEHELRFPADTLGRRKSVTLRLAVTIDNSADGVSIGVMDDLSHATGYASVRIK